MSYRSKPWYQGVLLGIFALVAAVALAFGYKFAAPEISQRLKEDLNASLEQVVPAALRDNDMSSDTVTVKIDGAPTTVYHARKDGALTAVAYRIIGTGYAGDIVIVMAVDLTGQITGVRVVQHAETPGLGDKIDVIKTNWIKSFDGLSLGNTPDEKWAVQKDGGQFDQFSGATITPRGVVKAVRHGLDVFHAKRSEMLGTGDAK